MTDNAVCSPNDKGLLLSPNLDITIDEGSPQRKQLLEVEDKGNELENDCSQLFEIDGGEHENGREETTGVDSHSEESQRTKDYAQPVEGVEFETYDDAYNYYNSYAREIGFAIRVKSSWTKRNSKEKRGAVLCCSCEGFKTNKEANSRRKETRTGCLAMIRLRVVESNRWRVDEVRLEHNHSFDPERAQNSKSHRRMDSGAKRKVEPTLDVEVRTIKLYRMPTVDASGYGSSNSNEGGTSNNIKFSRRLKLKKGDAELISNYFCHRKLIIRGCLVQFQEDEAFQMALTRVIYDPKTLDEFERDWDSLTQHYAIRNHAKLRSLHEDRELWAPVYSKDTFFAGISNYEKGESMIPFFKGHVHQQTSLKEFFEIYELVQQKKKKTEALDDLESQNSSPQLKTRCHYELQLSKLYTNAIFSKFQDEVVMMSSCFSVSQIQTNESIVTYMVKEHQGEEPVRNDRHFEVMYDKALTEVRCICNCFNFKGYLCRHALYILNYNGVGEIPCHYILSRWRKDFKRLYVPHLSSDNVDITNPVQCFDHLYKRGMQVVEEGTISQNHYLVSWQTFIESLNKVAAVKAIKPCSKYVFGGPTYMNYDKEK